MDYNACEIKKLAELLNDPNENEASSSDDDLPQAGMARSGPGDIGKRKLKVRFRGNQSTVDDKGNVSKVAAEEVDPDAIWDVSEVPEVPYSDDASSDPRDRPVYDFKYKQSVTSENVYLQLTNKTPMTASCEMLVVTVDMKGETRESVDCHIAKQQLDIRSPRYRLSLPLPHPVDVETSSAEWDSSSSQLVVSLALDRELDLVNF